MNPEFTENSNLCNKVKEESEIAFSSSQTIILHLLFAQILEISPEHQFLRSQARLLKHLRPSLLPLSPDRQTDRWLATAGRMESSWAHLQDGRALRRRPPHLLPRPWFHFWSGSFQTKKGTKWKARGKNGRVVGSERESGGDLYQKKKLSTGQWVFPPPFKCICRMLEWFITDDPAGPQWAGEMSDAISLLMSFSWSASSLGPVYLH